MAKKNRCKTEPKDFKTMQYWYSLTPTQRYKLMREDRSIFSWSCGKFRDAMKYINKKRLR